MASLRRRIFPPLLFLTLVIMIALNRVGEPLFTSTAPMGIISYEFAGNPQKATAVINSWDANARLHACFSLGLDYAFILVYTTTIALACLWTGEVLANRRWLLSGLGKPLAWGVCLAGALDAVENLGLVTMLLSGVREPWPVIAAWAAGFKFALILVALLFVAYGSVAWLVRRSPS